MDTKKVTCLVNTVKDWPEERKKDAIAILESVRDCFYTDQLVKRIEKDGEVVVCEGNYISHELTQIINSIKV